VNEKVESAAELEKRKTSVVVVATVGTTIVAEETNTKPFNYGSNSQRNGASRLRGYNENSVNNDNLNMTGAVDNYIPYSWHFCI